MQIARLAHPIRVSTVELVTTTAMLHQEITVVNVPHLSSATTVNLKVRNKSQ
jgi:hypothetical protein